MQDTFTHLIYILVEHKSRQDSRQNSSALLETTGLIAEQVQALQQGADNLPNMEGSSR